MIVYHIETTYEEYWISTVKYNHDIGCGRNAETMIFRPGFEEVYFEGHGRKATHEQLDKVHDRILLALVDGELELYNTEED